MNAVIYARYSSNNQREESIEGQLKVCNEFARANNYTIVGEYYDKAISGRTDQRPNFLKMIEDSKSKLFERVIVYKLDRFSRDKYDNAMYKQKLKKNNVKVISACESIPDDPTGVMIETMLEGMAEYYSANLATNVKRGMNTNAEHCISNGGTTPLGFYIGDDRKYHIDKENAHIVKIIFEMYSDGNTIKSIIDYLNSKNYKTVLGNKFNKNSICKMLRNKKYNGYYTYNDIEIKDGIPKIIDDDLFEKCQIIMENNKKAPARKKAEEEYLLSGKIVCGDCNSAMVGISGRGRNNNKYSYYRCKNSLSTINTCDRKSISKYYIEDLVFNETKKVLTDKNIEKIAKEIVDLCKKSTNTATIKYLKSQLNKNEKETNNLLRFYNFSWGVKIPTIFI